MTMDVSMAKRPRLESTSTFQRLPEDKLIFIIFRILKWLPAKSVSRFKTVSKQWRAIIEQEDFVLSHAYIAPIVPFNPDNKFLVVAYCGGILLEQQVTSKKFRVRNPCLRLVLDLPDPSKVSSRMNFAYDGQFKLVSFYDNNMESRGCEVLTLNANNLSWITVPATPEFSNNRIKVHHSLSCDGVAYYFWSHNDTHLEIGFESFDVRSESFSSTSLCAPDSFCSFLNVHAVCWREWLAVCAIKDDELFVMVLLDFKKQEWSERRAFGLRFLEENPGMREFPLSLADFTGEEYVFCLDGALEVRVDGGLTEVIGMEDIKEEGGERTLLRPLPQVRLRHTLVAHRGMQRETKI